MASPPAAYLSQQHAADADQVELNALRSGRAVITAGTDDEQLAGVLEDSAGDLAPLAGGEPWHLGDLAHDDSVGPIHEELSRRADGLQDAYPFELEDSALVHDSERRSGIYEFLLAASLSTHESLHTQLPRLFERVAARLIGSYFGRNARSRHFGWPRDDGASFEDAAKALHAHTGEWHWGPEEGLDPTHVKDEGCDFVIWLDASDGRKSGQLFVLGQCACGNNWQDKWRDLKVETLRRWFNPLSLVAPVKSFATPRHVADDLLKEASREAGIVFDRSRLVLAVAEQDVLDDETAMAMERLTRMVRDG